MDVDARYESLAQNSSHQEAATQLVDRIEKTPELLALLSFFHGDLRKLGITWNANTSSVWGYRMAYVSRLYKIHNVFWDQCRLMNVAQRHHKLGFSPTTIGILDPSNFDKEVYEQLQLGQFRGIDFNDVEVMGMKRRTETKTISTQT